LSHHYSKDQHRQNVEKLKFLERERTEHPSNLKIQEQVQDARRACMLPHWQFPADRLWVASTSEGLVFMVVPFGLGRFLGRSAKPTRCRTTSADGLALILPIVSAGEIPMAEAGVWAFAAEQHGFLACAEPEDEP